MNTAPISIASRGYIVEAEDIPPGFGAHLQRDGLAGVTAPTASGMYFEPRAPLAAIFAAFERFGVRVLAVRRAGGASAWQECARPAWRSRHRLGNRQSAEWLPTLPGA
jgi:hypothetical protein